MMHMGEGKTHLKLVHLLHTMPWEREGNTQLRKRKRPCQYYSQPKELGGFHAGHQTFRTRSRTSWFSFGLMKHSRSDRADRSWRHMGWKQGGRQSVSVRTEGPYYGAPAARWVRRERHQRNAPRHPALRQL